MMADPALEPEVLARITEALRSLRFGTVQITVHNARIVQIDRLERVRVPASADLTSGSPTDTQPTHRTSEGFRPFEHGR